MFLSYPRILILCIIYICAIETWMCMLFVYISWKNFILLHCKMVAFSGWDSKLFNCKKIILHYKMWDICTEILNEIHYFVIVHIWSFCHFKTWDICTEILNACKYFLNLNHCATCSSIESKHVSCVFLGEHPLPYTMLIEIIAWNVL